jgi:glycine cleavage system transcriptional repressor
MKKVIITIIGQDRPGILAIVSNYLFKNNCNIENISQTILQAEFAGIFVVSIPDDLSLNKLNKNLTCELLDFNIFVHIKLLESKKDNTNKKKNEVFFITTIGPDKKGLVANITKIIASFDINITNLKAVFKGGDDPNKNMMIYEVEIPIRVSLKDFSDKLKKRALELNLEISIQHKNIFNATNRI